MAVKPRFQPDFVDWVPFVGAEWPAALKGTLAAMAQFTAPAETRQHRA
jgi:hypothetical protein